MNRTDDLARALKKLRLSGVLETLPLRVRQMGDEGLDAEEFLHRLLADEVERREQKQLGLRMRRASFDSQKSLEDFDFAFNPRIPRQRVIELAAGHYLVRKENVCLVGPAGTGKSHLAQALGQRACRSGYSVLFIPTANMLTELRAARADNSYARRLLRFTTPDLLLLDDLGLRPLRHEEPEDLYEVIRQRHQRGSTIITSNRDIEEWPPLFGEPLLASAALDRLLQDAHVVEMPGDSFRTSARAKRGRGGPAASGSDT